MKKVSIITATYNSAKTISDTLNSIINQSYLNIELIIVDGASNDNTLEIVNSLLHKTNREKIIISESDKGLYDALNKGLSIASGDIIGFLHSDDIFNSSDTISQIVECFLNKKITCVYGDLVYTKQNDLNQVVRLWKSKSFTPNLLKYGWMPAHPTLFLKKEVYQKHGNFNLSYTIAADYDFMVRILSDYSLKFYYYSKIITKMRLGGASNTNLKHIIKKTKEDYIIVKSNGIGGILTIFRKNFSKINQFFYKNHKDN